MKMPHALASHHPPSRPSLSNYSPLLHLSISLFQTPIWQELNHAVCDLWLFSLNLLSGLSLHSSTMSMSLPWWLSNIPLWEQPTFCLLLHLWVGIHTPRSDDIITIHAHILEGIYILLWIDMSPRKQYKWPISTGKSTQEHSSSAKQKPQPQTTLHH